MVGVPYISGSCVGRRLAQVGFAPFWLKGWTQRLVAQAFKSSLFKPFALQRPVSLLSGVYVMVYRRLSFNLADDGGR